MAISNVKSLDFIRNRVIYSDFPKSLDISPVNKDVSRIVNDTAVKESIRNLILTNRGERLFHPEIGCDIRSMLFDNLTPDRIKIARELIKETINNFEPRCNLIDIDVLASGQNSVSITFVYNVVNTETPVIYSMTINRIR